MTNEDAILNDFAYFKKTGMLKNKKDPNPNGGIVNNQTKAVIKEEPKLSQEDYEKYVFIFIQCDTSRLLSLLMVLLKLIYFYYINK